MNVNKLKGLMVEKEKNADVLSTILGMNRATFYRKLSNPEEFTVGDVMHLKDALEMTDAQAVEIFLS